MDERTQRERERLGENREGERGEERVSVKRNKTNWPPIRRGFSRLSEPLPHVQDSLLMHGDYGGGLILDGIQKNGRPPSPPPTTTPSQPAKVDVSK